MCRLLAYSDYYGAFAPSRAFNRRRIYPAVSGGSRTEGATRDGSRVHCESIDQSGTQLCPGSIATATPQTFTVASPPTRQVGFEVDPPAGRSCTAPRPLSTRFEPVPRLRSFTTGSSRMPSDPARRTRSVWQSRIVPALSALLPALPDVSRVGLRSAPTRLLRQPGEEVLHLPRLPAPHGAQAPRGGRDTTCSQCSWRHCWVSASASSAAPECRCANLALWQFR